MVRIIPNISQLVHCVFFNSSSRYNSIVLSQENHRTPRTRVDRSGFFHINSASGVVSWARGGCPFEKRYPAKSLIWIHCVMILEVTSWFGNSVGSTLWLFNIAMENGPFIDDFPINTSIYKEFSMAILNNQVVRAKTSAETILDPIVVDMCLASSYSCTNFQDDKAIGTWQTCWSS